MKRRVLSIVVVMSLIFGSVFMFTGCELLSWLPSKDVDCETCESDPCKCCEDCGEYPCVCCVGCCSGDLPGEMEIGYVFNSEGNILEGDSDRG